MDAPLDLCVCETTCDFSVGFICLSCLPPSCLLPFGWVDPMASGDDELRRGIAELLAGHQKELKARSAAAPTSKPGAAAGQRPGSATSRASSAKPAYSKPAFSSSKPAFTGAKPGVSGSRQAPAPAREFKVALKPQPAGAVSPPPAPPRKRKWEDKKSKGKAGAKPAATPTSAPGVAPPATIAPARAPVAPSSGAAVAGQKRPRPAMSASRPVAAPAAVGGRSTGAPRAESASRSAPSSGGGGSGAVSTSDVEACLRRIETRFKPGQLRNGEGNWYDAPATTTAAVAVAIAPPATPATAGASAADAVPARKVAPLPESPAIIQRFRAVAERFWRADTEADEAKRAGATSAQAKWMKTVLSTGTASDKLAAMTLLVQEAPVHSIRHIDGLLSLARKKGRRESQQAIDALKDLFTNNLLPGERKLLPFDQRTISGVVKELTPEQLILWIFEDALKERYRTFISVLQEHLSDALPYFKANALKTVADLLSEKPEQEGALLALLVNKLGDPTAKIASKAQYLLSILVAKHEAMKAVVVREVRQLLIRPHLSNQAQYFATAFLNQLVFHPEENVLARDLISTYFSLFELCVKRNQMNTKLLAALLTGIHRAFPYTRDDETQAAIEERADNLFTIVHRGSFAAAVQALSVLQHVCARRIESGSSGVVAPASAAPDAQGTFVDRYYRALYSVLTVEALSSTSRYSLILNLLFKSLKSDPSAPRIRALLKRLTQVALYLSAPFAAGVLFMVAELVRQKVEIRSLLEATAVEAAVEVEVEAPVLSAEATLAAMDATLAGGKGKGAATAPTPPTPTTPTTGTAGAPATPPARTFTYDPWKREPKYAGAEGAFLWELAPLALHYHPSVRKFADDIMLNPGFPIDYSGDPLADFTVRGACCE